MDNLRWLKPSLLVLMFVTCLLSISVGPLSIGLKSTVSGLLNWLTNMDFGTVAPYEQAVINNVRLPRTFLALGIGAILAICGAVMQGLFRNPLADPGIVGVSTGAALGAAICIVLLPSLGEGFIAFSAFIGGLVTTLIVYRLATSQNGTSVVLLLLAGIAIAALFGAGIGILTYVADDNALRDLSLWQMGSIAGASWFYVGLVTIALAVVVYFFQKDSMALNALLLGESEARHLGINVERLKLRSIVLCSLGVGIGVAASGIIGFVGLVVPHIVRMLIGPDHRQLLPMSALLGAGILGMADIGARALMPPAEVPVGLITALLGAPFFIYLLLTQRHRLM